MTINKLKEKYNEEFEIFVSTLEKPLGSNDYLQILLCIDNAHNKIIDYMKWKEYNTSYIMAKITLAMLYYKYNKNIVKSMSDNPQLSSYTEGNRSESYKYTEIKFDNDGLTVEVKAMLPRPRIQVI